MCRGDTCDFRSSASIEASITRANTATVTINSSELMTTRAYFTSAHRCPRAFCEL